MKANKTAYSAKCERKMAYNNLNDEDLRKFIKSYKEKECLWNKTCEGYNNVMLKIKSYNQLSKEFNMNGLNVKRLINSIRASFFREWNMMISERCTTLPPYTPQIKWYNEMIFLVDDVLQTNFKNNVIDNEHDYVEYLQEEVYTVPKYPSEDAMKYLKTELATTKISSCRLSSPDSYLAVAKAPPIIVPQAIHSTTNEVFEYEADSDTNDEIDSFCKSLATQMMKLPVRSLIQLQMEIQNLISNKRLEELTNSNQDLF